MARYYLELLLLVWSLVSFKKKVYFVGKRKMKSGKCPKCGSTEVYFRENVFPHDASQIRINAMNYAPFNYYVCVDCGYMEYYISNPKKLKKIEQHWEKASDVDQTKYI